jgi:hypothetical protein
MTPPFEAWAKNRRALSPEAAHAFSLVEADLPLPPVADASLERIRRRLSAPQRRAPWIRWHRGWVAAALAASSLAAAAMVRWSPAWRPVRTSPEPIAQPWRPARRVQTLAPAQPEPVMPAAEPAGIVAAPPLHRRPVALAAPVEAAPPSSSPSASTLAEEAALLSRGLRQLEVQHDAAAAARTLGDYAQRFPHGTLAGEARTARVDALVRSGQRALALAELDQEAPRGLSALPQGQELGVLRAELLAESGDCAAALTAFEHVPADGPRALRERALWGRAACRATLGDASGSRQDLQQYLVSFPNGRFAAAARAALGH